MKFINSFLALFLVTSCLDCSGLRNSQRQTQETNAQQAQSEIGMVAAAHPAASSAGLAMLAIGGNAIDAAVAASFAISVVRPQSTGIGGGGFLLWYDKEKKDVKAYDFRERAPLKATTAMYLDVQGKTKNCLYQGHKLGSASVDGHLAVGVPGLVAGLVEMQERYGTLPLHVVMEPAITLADKGFEVYPALSQAIKERQEVLKAFAASRKIFLPRGKVLQPGEILIQKDLAQTLRTIARFGKPGFYAGPVAHKIIAEIKRGKGILSQQDLAEVKVIERPVIEGNYRGYTVASMPPPSSGGVHLIEMLNMLSTQNISVMGNVSTAYIHLLSETMKRAFADRARYMGDSDFVSVPVKALTSPAYAQELAATIDYKAAIPAQKLLAVQPQRYESPSTTHISVVDKFGNAVSTTQTINYTFGSGVVAAGTGVVLNDEMDDFTVNPQEANVFGLRGGSQNAVAARKTMLSSMSPTMVFDRNKELKLVLGSPGGPRIINAVLQTIINVVDFKMDLARAVNTARIHHQWMPDRIVYEQDEQLSSEMLNQLKAMGHQLQQADEKIGDVQAIEINGNTFIGVSDRRSDGEAMGL